MVIGETGIAAWAGFLATTRDENLRQQFGLDGDSRIVIIATGGTDRSRGLLQPCWHDSGSGFGGNRTSTGIGERNLR